MSLRTANRRILGPLAAALLVTATVAAYLSQDRPVVAAAAPSSSNPAAARPTFDFKGRIRPLFEKYCVECHSGSDPEAGLDLKVMLDGGVPAHRKTWEKALGLVRLENMPPADSAQPTKEERELLVSWMDDALFYVDCRKPADPGRVTVRRLNRAEYNNAVRDLLAIDFEPAKDFPLDDVGYGFDNIGDVLTVPPLLIEKYLDASEQVVERAIATPESLEVTKTIRGTDFIHPKAPDAGDGARLLVTNGEFIVPVKVDFPGKYQASIRAYADQAGTDPALMELRQNGKVVKEFQVRKKKDGTFTTEVELPAGESKLGIAFTNDFYDEVKKQDRNLYVQSLSLKGPIGAGDELRKRNEQVIKVTPDAKTSLEVAARVNLQTIMKRAFRRPVTPDEVKKYVAFVTLATKKGQSFERGMRVAIQAILVSPDFLFRVENTRETDAYGRALLDDYSLASRMSFFLWSSVPDEELMRAAGANELRTERGLTKQVNRMLADKRSVALVTNFAAQWLALRKLRTEDVMPSKEQFPEFNEQLRDDMIRETELFVEEMIRSDRSVLTLIDGKYTFVNERLAKLYGLDGIKGDDFQRVELKDPNRSGVLTQPAILTLTSYPTRTSPVKRGQWVLETLLGDEPPPPPPVVPGLEETTKSNPNLPMRKQLELHRADPGCKACHKLMDEIGFGLENFDAIGRWRTQDGPNPIEPTGALPTGEHFSGPGELVAIVRAREDEFRHCLTEKLLTYALGRGVEYYDRCAIDQITRRLKDNGSRFSALVLAIVQSDPFRMTRKADR
jgi:mono/diheme cytochrome c family protein